VSAKYTKTEADYPFSLLLSLFKMIEKMEDIH